jgi:hypothetical protein
MKGELFASLLQFDNINSLGAFWAAFSIKADRVTFGKGFVSFTLDGRMVNKSITTVSTRNKAKTLVVVKPLYGSLVHFCYLLIYRLKSQKVSATKKGHKDQKIFVAS